MVLDHNGPHGFFKYEKPTPQTFSPMPTQNTVDMMAISKNIVNDDCEEGVSREVSYDEIDI